MEMALGQRSLSLFRRRFAIENSDARLDLPTGPRFRTIVCENSIRQT